MSNSDTSIGRFYEGWQIYNQRIVEVGPDAPVRQATVLFDVEGQQPLGVGVGDDQGRVVGRHEHTVGEGDVIGHLPSRAIGVDQSDGPGGEFPAGHKVEARAVDVGVAATIHHQLVPRGPLGDAGQIGVGHQRAVGLPAQEKPIARGDDQ